ncbi:MAG: hypothetical protein DMD34_05020 [Gemmatimonadetes bacterium]|nr:MAG: hypothetical protein DMD34_05020 [Gemmatimonadota bacterium]
MIPVRWILTAVAVVAIAACSSDSIGSPQGGGSLVLRLTTPHGDDGALTFELSGPSISTVSAPDASLRLFTRRLDESTVVGVVVGALANGALATLRVQEVSTVSSYSARVLEVADREDGLRASLSGYALSVTR